MTNQQVFNALFTAMAAAIQVNPNPKRLTEFELIQRLIEVFKDPDFEGLIQDGLDKNLFGINTKSGIPFPTQKGMSLLFDEMPTKVVNKMTTKPTNKLTDSELISTFEATGKELCQRIPNGKILQHKIIDNYETIYDTCACVVENVNALVTVQEAVA